MKPSPNPACLPLLVIASAALSLSTTGCRSARAQSTENEPPREVRLTVYKQDFATVSETRDLQLSSGRSRIRLDGVSRELDPKSVIFDWKGADPKPEIVTHIYDLGVNGNTNLLDRLEGSQVEMLWASQDGKPRDSIKGVLEGTQGGGFLIRSGDKLYINPQGTIVAPSSTPIVTMPALSAEVESTTASTSKVDFSYQTRGMSWSADYVAKLLPEGDFVDLECWATVTNGTGVNFPNAKVSLVAGTPNRAVRHSSYLSDTPRREISLEYDAGSFQRKAIVVNRRSFDVDELGDLHVYKAPAKASIGSDQMNRVKLFGSNRVPVKKDYSIRLPAASSYGLEVYEKSPYHQNAELAIKLTNAEKDGLGMPLPSGAVRVYDRTADETAYVGAAEIEDTAKDQRVSLTLSKVFDVYSDSRMVSIKKIGKKTMRVVFEAVLNNQKSTPVELRLVQGIGGKRKIVSQSHQAKPLNASELQWKVRVAPGKQEEFTWTMDLSHSSRALDAR